MKYLLLILPVLCSCSANWHLKQAKKHLLIAESKGAEIKADTVFKEVAVPFVKVDTVVKDVPLEKLLRDTIVVTQKDQVIKIKYVPTEKKIYVKSERKKPVYIKVPVAVNQNISAGYGFQEMAVLGAACAFVGFVIGLFVYAKRKKDAVHN